MERRGNSTTAGLVLILLGTVVLGHMNGWWSFNWQFMAVFWPLLLIVIGLRLLFPRGLTYDLIALGLLIVAVGAQTLAPPPPEPDRGPFGGFFNRADSQEKADIKGPAIAGAKELRFSATAAAGTFTLKSLGEDNNRLYTARLSRGSFEQSDRREGDTAISEISPKHRAIFGFEALDYDLALTPELPLELSIDTGASKAELDLSGLQLTKLDFNAGATSSVIRLGSKSSRQRLTIDLGASSLTLHVPKELGLKITFDSGLSSNNFEEAGLNKSNDTYITPDFDQAHTQIEIELDGGASSVKLERA